jgi:hypothetical protein
VLLLHARMMKRAIPPLAYALALCAIATSVACSSTGDGSQKQAECPQAFFVDADMPGAQPGPLPNDKCAGLCKQDVFSCAVASTDGGTASVECQPSCTGTTSTASR